MRARLQILRREVDSKFSAELISDCAAHNFGILNDAAVLTIGKAEAQEHFSPDLYI